LAPTVRAQIVHLTSTRYEALNDVHLTEKLQEVHGLHVSHSSAQSSHWPRGARGARSDAG
jgi:hypothetical protein